MKDREWLAMGCRMVRVRGVSLAWPVQSFVYFLDLVAMVLSASFEL
jgi:hypothetical protein